MVPGMYQQYPLLNPLRNTRPWAMPWKRAKRVRRVTLPWQLCRQMAWSFESWANFEQIRSHNTVGSHLHGEVFRCILFELYYDMFDSIKHCRILWTSLRVSLKPGWLFIRRVHALLSQEVVLAAVQHTGMALFYASPALRDDNEAVCGLWMLHFTMELFGILEPVAGCHSCS